MQAAAQNPLIGKAYGIIRTLSHDEETRLLAQSREKALRDAWDREEGARAEGREEGREEGRLVGREEERFGIVSNMIRKKFSLEQISDATGLSLPDIDQIISKNAQHQ